MLFSIFFLEFSMCFKSYIVAFILLSFSLEAVQHPTGFISLETCIEKGSDAIFLLSEDDSKQFVLVLDQGVVVNEGGIVTQEGKILQDTETYLQDQQRLLNVNRNIAEEEITYFDGKLVVLSSPGQENWYHWLLQVLPRLKILVDSGIEYDKIYINNLKFPWQHQSLFHVMKLLDIPKDRLFLVDGDAIVQATKLIIPSVPYIPSKLGSIFPSWYKQFIHSCFLLEKFEQTNRKIYISRSNASLRRVVNENELISFLKDEGFEVVHLEKMSVFDQTKAFCESKVIMGPHGSGFSNLIFSSPGAHVIEIDHGLKGDEQRSCFQKMTQVMECNYCPYYADEVEEEDLEKDIPIDLQNFKSFYKNLGL